MQRNISYWNYKKTLENLDDEQQKKLEEVETLTQSLMEEYGVTHYKFRWSYGKSLGTCSYDTISIQLNHALNSPVNLIKDTVLHEIAHAAVGWRTGHRMEWQNKAREMGVTWRKGKYRS